MIRGVGKPALAGLIVTVMPGLLLASGKKQQLWRTRAALNETDHNYPKVQAIINANE